MHVPSQDFALLLFAIALLSLGAAVPGAVADDLEPVEKALHKLEDSTYALRDDVLPPGGIYCLPVEGYEECQ